MLRNYLVTALRALARNRQHAAINIAGLAIGLAGTHPTLALREE